MITQLKASIAFRAALRIYTLNPVKLTMVLLIYSSLVTLHLWHLSATTWFPLIFYILFIGGILIIFMILSSGIPNEKVMKLKIEIFLIAAIAASRLMLPGSTMGNATLTKGELITNHSFALIATIIILYFFFFLKIVRGKKSPTRNLFSCPYRKTCKLSKKERL